MKYGRADDPALDQVTYTFTFTKTEIYRASLTQDELAVLQAGPPRPRQVMEILLKVMVGIVGIVGRPEFERYREGAPSMPIPSLRKESAPGKKPTIDHLLTHFLTAYMGLPPEMLRDEPKKVSAREYLKSKSFDVTMLDDPVSQSLVREDELIELTDADVCTDEEPEWIAEET